MTRYVAFLRGINLGGRRPPMAQLRELFGNLGFSDVATFIASGNVIFASDEQDTELLEAKISAHFEVTLGYEVAAFARSMDEVRRVVSAQPFPQAEVDRAGHNLHVTFFRARLEPEATKRVRALAAHGRDTFDVVGREVYWLARGGISDAPVTMEMLWKAAGTSDNTMRNMNTLRRILDKFGTY